MLQPLKQLISQKHVEPKLASKPERVQITDYLNIAPRIPTRAFEPAVDKPAKGEHIKNKPVTL